MQQTSFFYSSYDKKCISSSLSVLQIQRQSLLPYHFGDTQIAIPINGKFKEPDSTNSNISRRCGSSKPTPTPLNGETRKPTRNAKKKKRESKKVYP